MSELVKLGIWRDQPINWSRDQLISLEWPSDLTDPKGLTEGFSQDQASRIIKDHQGTIGIWALPMAFTAGCKWWSYGLPFGTAMFGPEQLKPLQGKVALKHVSVKVAFCIAPELPMSWHPTIAGHREIWLEQNKCLQHVRARGWRDKGKEVRDSEFWKTCAWSWNTVKRWSRVKQTKFPR